MRAFSMGFLSGPTTRPSIAAPCEKAGEPTRRSHVKPSPDRTSRNTAGVRVSTIDGRNRPELRLLAGMAGLMSPPRTRFIGVPRKGAAWVASIGYENEQRQAPPPVAPVGPRTTAPLHAPVSTRGAHRSASVADVQLDSLLDRGDSRRFEVSGGRHAPPLRHRLFGRDAHRARYRRTLMRRSMSRLSTVDGILAPGNRRQGFRPIAIANLAFVASIALGALALASDEFEIDDSKRLLTESGDGTLRPGDLVRDAAFRDIDGKEHWLYASLERGPAVLVFLSTSCPMAARYSKRLEQLDAQLVERGATVYGIFSGSGETLESVREHRERASFRFPIIHDRDARLARHVDATMTPQAFVIDKSRRLRYRGAIDDNRIEDRVKARYLEDALRSVLAGEKVALETTRSAGCSIHFPDPPAPKDVTYTRHIAPILADRCEGCHRAGQVAPFALSSYEDAKRWSTEIRAYTEKRLMPPWKPARGFGDLIDHTSLSDEEMDLIAKWVEAGTPEGDSKDLPPRPRFTDGWAYGEPDLVLEMPEEYIVGPEGEDDYRHLIIPIELDDDRYVQAVDVRPGNARTVHHVIAYVDTSGRARELDAKDPGPGYTRFGGTGFDPVSTLGGWAPGFTPQRTPEGSGAWLPKRADVVLQVHYYRTGFEERDRPRVGPWF